ncbi:MAG TPA: 3-dehydroquinate synthase II [Thermoplasmata archaeon]|nr:3-dehydroquinate synthase II [Thermoplasmata archaeon]
MSRDRVAIRPRPSTPQGLPPILDRAHQRGFHRFVLVAGDAGPTLGPDTVVIRERAGFLEPTGRQAPIPIARVDSEAGLAQALEGAPSGGVLAIEWTADRVIPLENAVAARGQRFALWVVARSPAEVPGALGALEHGADLVIVDVGSPEEVDQLESLVEGPLPSLLKWSTAPLLSVGPAGLGDRVIVDTTSLLRPDEGLLVGSAAAFLFHVASEATGSKFSRPRPFRVNAGSAHSYVLLADGSTRYLAELASGDAVLIATPDGSIRSVRVGRIKVERRPMVLVRADDQGTVRTIFLQEAESVRLTTAGGPTPTTELKAGQSARGVRLPAARHLGHPVDETIEER